jgi:hypothetical protein
LLKALEFVAQGLSGAADVELGGAGVGVTSEVGGSGQVAAVLLIEGDLSREAGVYQ